MIAPDFISQHRARTEQFQPLPGRRFNHLLALTPADCALCKPRGYLVKDLIAPGDLALIFGQPGAGKSVIAPHIGYAVAQGRAVFDRRVRSGPVVYITAEDPHGLPQRVHALRIVHGDAPNFYVIQGVTNLFAKDAPDVSALIAAVEAIQPVLVIIDTLAAAFPGIRENESDDMQIVLGVARDLQRSRAANSVTPAVIIVHHAPKADDATPRGHGSLNGAVDMTIRLAIDTEEGIVRGKLGKNRNGPCDVTLEFSIRSVCIGTDEDGDAITAPVAQEMDEQDRAPRNKPKLTKAENTAKRYLADLLCDQGKPLPIGPNWPMGLLGVPETEWRAVCESRRLSTAEKPDDRARIFRRAYQELLTKSVVAARDGLVWLTHPEGQNS